MRTRDFAEIPCEALVRLLQMIAHGAAGAGRIARRDGVADGHVLQVRDPPGGVVADVPRELREIWIDALVEELPDLEAVIVDSENQVRISTGLRKKLTILHNPTDGI